MEFSYQSYDVGVSFISQGLRKVKWLAPIHAANKVDPGLGLRYV